MMFFVFQLFDDFGSGIDIYISIEVFFRMHLVLCVLEHSLLYCFFIL